MASIIDDGVQAGDMKHIFVIGCYMILAAIVGLFAGVMGGKYGAKASTGFARNLREAMYENIQTFSFSNIDKFSTAGLVTRIPRMLPISRTLTRCSYVCASAHRSA